MESYYSWMTCLIKAGIYKVHWQSVWKIVQKGVILEIENKLRHRNLELHASRGKQEEKDEGWSRGITSIAPWPLLATSISLLSQFWILWVLYHGIMCTSTHCLWCPFDTPCDCGHHRYASTRISISGVLLPESSMQNSCLYISSNKILADPWIMVPSPVSSLGSLIWEEGSICLESHDHSNSYCFQSGWCHFYATAWKIKF